MECPVLVLLTLDWSQSPDAKCKYNLRTAAKTPLPGSQANARIGVFPVSVAALVSPAPHNLIFTGGKVCNSRAPPHKKAAPCVQTPRLKSWRYVPYI